MREFYNKLVNRDYPYIISEIGANHNGDIKLAKKMINKAKECGCDAVKFQSWTKYSLLTKNFYKEQNQFADKNFGTLEEMVDKFSLSKEDHIILKKYCDNKKITFCSTPSTLEEVDMLDELNV
ncbi:unnamed protein product, partial [marine sediment metagenome]